uniref:Uncharacterized protein n=1 Tax=Anopheles minimus TaxID=112268 RepID=A0A182WP05_9DIPT
MRLFSSLNDLSVSRCESNSSSICARRSSFCCSILSSTVLSESSRLFSSKISTVP